MTRPVDAARALSELFSVLLFIGGGVVLAGWVLQIPVLKSILPGLITMKANTAVCFVLTAIALWGLQVKRADIQPLRLFSGLCIALLLSIAITTICEYALGTNLGIDRALFPGRMALSTSINFLLIGISLLFSNRKMPGLHYMMQLLALAAAYISLLNLICYCYAFFSFHPGQAYGTSMALHTTIFFLLAAFGVLFLRPDGGLMGQVTSEYTGGRVLRQFLPVAVLAPIGMVILDVLARRSNWFNDQFSVSFVTAGNLAIFSLYVYFLSRLLNHADIKSKALNEVTLSSKERIENIINAVADPIFVKDKDHRWVLLNSAFSAFAGYRPDQLMGRSDRDIFPKEQADIFWSKDEEVFRSRAEVVNKEFFTDAHGELKLILTKKTLYTDSAGDRFIVGVITDLTEQNLAHEKIELQSRELEKALKEAIKTRSIMISMLDDNNQIRTNLERHLKELKSSQNMLINSEKLASLGRLVSEMAHEVNNPLMIISGNAQLSLMTDSLGEEDRHNLETIISECQRAKNVIRRVLRFARPSKGDIKNVAIAQSIESVVGIIERQFLIGASVEIKRSYQEDAPPVPIDEQQIQEVFMNLLNNAKEAMPGGGVISIKTSVEDNFFKIDFKDTGIGMPEDIMNKIMEPFFTTKETGTGIGLSVCYGIIKSHNGELRYESAPGKGTIATILLPLTGEG